MALEFRYKRRVQFADTDAAGIAHFSAFFRYMEEAEHALWRSLGLRIHPTGARVGFPRVSATCEFKRPLHFEQEFEVCLQAMEVGSRTIRYGWVLTSDGTDVASGALTVVCVEYRPGEPLRAAEIPAHIADALRGTTAGELASRGAEEGP